MTGAGFCPQCGTERVSPQLRYCGSCGFDYQSVSASKAPGPGPGPLAGAPPPAATQQRPLVLGVVRQWTPANIALIGAGVALIVAPFLPFISAAAALIGSVSRTGIELVGPEALLIVVTGVVVAATGFQHASGMRTRRRWPLVASVGANALTAWYFVQLNDRVQSVASDYASASIGTGLWLAVAGSVVSLFVVIFKS